MTPRSVPVVAEDKSSLWAYTAPVLYVTGLVVGAAVIAAWLLNLTMLQFLGAYGVPFAASALVVSSGAGVIARFRPADSASPTMIEDPDDPVAWADREIDTYSALSFRQCWGYRLCKVPALLAAAAIPVVVLLSSGNDTQWKLAVAALGAVIMLLEGMQHLFRFQENWTASATTRDQLRRERQLYVTGAGPYLRRDAETSRDFFMMRASAIIAGEQGPMAPPRVGVSAAA